MKTFILTGACVLSALLLAAQKDKKTTTVRIKKVENINGVEKVTDTTYTTTEPIELRNCGTRTQVIATDDLKSGESKEVIIIDDQVIGGDNANVKILRKGEAMDEEIEKALKEAGVNPGKTSMKKMIIVNEDVAPGDKKGEKRMTKIVVLRKAKIVDASDNEMKMLGKESGIADNKLVMNDMRFYPNPSNGKFNLAFSLPEKGNTGVSIMDIQGKAIYSEKLENFSGSYDKEIDISENPKGIYFVKIEQGDHAQIKKIILE